MIKFPIRKYKKPMPIVEENLKISIQNTINKFIENEQQSYYEFPSSFTNEQRAYVHEYVKEKGLISKSQGKGTSRFLTIYKKDKTSSIKSDATFDITENSKRFIYRLLQRYPLTNEEKSDLNRLGIKKTITPYRLSVGNLNNPNLSIPPPIKQKNSILEEKKQLPIYEYKTAIINLINNNQIIVISGDTGSGKTTQVPQYILEHATENNINCRIICTQPRRLSAISVAERVCYERNENIGKTIGYQIRLESRTSPTSNLIYCTNGVLLRTLLGGGINDLLKNITHLIIDEVHERDKISDFLLITIKENLTLNKHLKIILMSATIDGNIFTDYFHNCPFLNVKGRQHNVDYLYLENILNMIGYKHPNTKEKTCQDENISDKVMNENDNCPAVDETTGLIDTTLKNIWLNNEKNLFDQFFYFIEGENYPIDYMHAESKMTALMVAAGRNYPDIVLKLLYLNADPLIESFNGFTALDFAIHLNSVECIEILKNKILSLKTNGDDKNSSDLKECDSTMLNSYFRTDNDKEIDHSLLFMLIKHIHLNNCEGSILIFLPGYDDIIEQYELLTLNIKNNVLKANIIILMLHSNMPIIDQNNVFNPAPTGCRKIILSTNIAETSITINDVTYVIDCGKEKQKTFDAITGTSSLMIQWISKACAKQRAGRAGRTKNGICYRVYTQKRFNSFADYTLPEISRTPLTEICLHTKLLINDKLIVDYLMKALNPPPMFSIKQSIKLLQSIDALDINENMTILGIHLADLPVDVRLGKILIYSIFFKCLDPIMTIVSALSVKDPFILPGSAVDRQQATQIKKKLTENTLSDHLSLLKCYQKWLDNKAMGNEKRFCSENYLNCGTMETIAGIRSQILGHLRAISFVKAHGKGNIHDLNKFSNNWAIVKACLLAGLYPNICRIDRISCCLKTRLDKILPHPSSTIYERNSKKFNDLIQNYPTDWIIFEEKIRNGRFCFIKTNTFVTPITIALFGGTTIRSESETLVECDNDDDSDYGGDNVKDFEIGHFVENENSQSNVENNKKKQQELQQPEKSLTKFIIDDWIEFKLDTNIAYLIYNLRQKINTIFSKFLNNHKHYIFSDKDLEVIDILSKILEEEDLRYNLPQPANIGLRPRSVMLNLATNVNFGIQETNNNNYASNFDKLNVEIINKDDVNPKLLNAINKYDTNTKSMSSYSSNGNYGRKENNNNNNNKKLTYNSNKSNQNNFVDNTQQNAVFFIVNALSKRLVFDCIRDGEWKFSQNVYRYISKIYNQNPSLDIVIFFYIQNSNSFSCAISFKINKNNDFVPNLISDNCLSISELRSFIKTKFRRECNYKYLDYYHDGELVPFTIGKLLLETYYNQQ